MNSDSFPRPEVGVGPPSSALASPGKRTVGAPVVHPDLDDCAKYFCRAGVPILDVHESPLKGRVDEALLHLLAANTNERIAHGNYPLLLLGHTDDDAAETDQPLPVGLVGRLVVGEYDGRPCLLADLYYSREHYEHAKTFPHRSVERVKSDACPEKNVIENVSLLRRPPERHLGLVSDARDFARVEPGDVQLIRYARHFPELGGDEVSNPHPNPSTTQKGFDMPMTPEQEQELESFIRKVFDKIVAELDDAGANENSKASEANGPFDDDSAADTDHYDAAMPSGTNTFVPGPACKKQNGELDRMALAHDPDAVLVRYQTELREQRNKVATLEQKVQELMDDRDTIMIRYQRSEAEKILQGLLDEGIVFDFDKELRRYLALPEEEREEHVEAIRVNYRRSPVGQGMIPTGSPRTASQAPSDEERKAVIDFATAHGITDIRIARERFRAQRGA
jgi:hypothetical protein